MRSSVPESDCSTLMCSTALAADEVGVITERVCCVGLRREKGASPG